MSDEIKSARVTTAEAAKAIGCSKTTVNVLVKKGKLKAFYLNGTENASGVTRKSLEDFLASVQ